MNKERIYKYMEQPGEMDDTSTDELQRLVEEYPYFQTARLLYTQNLHETQDEQFSEELGKTAIFCADRSRLFYLIHAERYEKLLKHPEGDTLSDSDRTEVLLDSYLRSFEEKVQSQPDSKSPILPNEEHAASMDYFGYLDSVGETIDDSNPQQKSFQHQDIIDAFLEKADNDDIRPAPPKEWTPVDEEPSDGTEGEFLTETLAKIYIKQKKYDQALAIIKRLSLNFPKKSAYFADQIRFLEYLIINEKNKNK